MRTTFLTAAAVVAITFATGAAQAAPGPHVTAAVADVARPADDVKRDADRKPAEMLEFAGVKPGSTVAEFSPGRGYFTRIFAKAVGAKGKVYAIINPPPANAPNPPPILALAADPAYGNIEVNSTGYMTFTLPQKADVVWTSQNFHDLYARTRGFDVPKIVKQIYDATKPGGVFIVLDHSAVAGAAIDPDDKLHRIDGAAVRKEVEAAGFKYEGELNVLRNPADDRTKPVFDPSLRGHTDQFIYKFRKPK
jgi:predicted methyltransferase